MAMKAPQERQKMNFDEMWAYHCSVLSVTETETMFVFRQNSRCIIQLPFNP